MSTINIEELNEKAAKIMELVKGKYGYYLGSKYTYKSDYVDEFGHEYWDPCNNMNQAFEVLRKITKNNEVLNLEIRVYSDGSGFQMREHTQPCSEYFECNEGLEALAIVQACVNAYEVALFKELSKKE